MKIIIFSRRLNMQRFKKFRPVQTIQLHKNLHKVARFKWIFDRAGSCVMRFLQAIANSQNIATHNFDQALFYDIAVT